LREYEGFSGLALLNRVPFGKFNRAGGRTLSFRGLSPGETAGPACGTMRRGQDSPADKSLKRPAREPRPPAPLPARRAYRPEGRAYAPEGTEEKPSYPALPCDQLHITDDP